MGYSITIGQPDFDAEDLFGFKPIRKERHETAPTDGVPTDYKNERWPSYMAWSDFVESDKRLADVFSELMEEHPGSAMIEQRHNDIIQSINPESLPDYHRVRLIWLQYWMKWAIENCENPTITNT